VSAAFVAACVAILLVAGLRPTPPVAAPTVHAPPPVGAPSAPAHPVPVDAAGDDPPEAWPARFEARVDRARASCGLPVRTHCDATGCAAIVASPDLDRLGGWLRLLGRHPRFVFQTAARDLGLPDDLLSCGQAVEALAADGATASVELPDGTEIWCLPTDPSGRTTWDADQRALCARAAADHAGRPVSGFDAPSLRRLRFRRD